MTKQNDELTSTYKTYEKEVRELSRKLDNLNQYLGRNTPSHVTHFGYLLSCLTIDMREKISRAIGINLSSDTYRELVYKYVYALKDLRNAIAHNDVVYDTRFRKMDPSRPMKQCLILEMGLPYMNFKTIGDYIILICYYLKLLKVSKTEIKVTSLPGIYSPADWESFT